MSSRNILIPVKYNTYGYRAYCEFIRPYLEVFGMPYTETPVNQLEKKLADDAAAVFIAQPGLILSDAEAQAIMKAVENGCGLICADGAALHNPAFADICTFIDMQEPETAKEITIAKSHYITKHHAENEKINLYNEENFYTNTALNESTTLAKIGNFPLLEIAEYKSAKLVLWNNISWARTDILGPLHGMDDILCSSIIWAAKKPFVMKGMPPFVGMRVDDVWGAWRDKCPESPMQWLDTAIKYGLKPWLGIFPDNINEKSIDIVKRYTAKGYTTAFPHAFAGCEWVGSDIPEHWAYFDHIRSRPWSDEVMAENAARAKKWFDDNSIPISKLALPHYYETGENALQYFLDWGCEFIGIQMPPDSSYFSCARLKCGPYRNYTQLPSSDSHPVYYADYLEFPHNPTIDKKLFNCVTEIRDVRGYEFAPTNDVEDTIDSGITQLRRAITSSVPAVLFTHESKWIQRITPENWETEIKAITSGIADLDPIYDTMDNICRYVRASHDIKIENAELDSCGKLKINITGKNDIETKCAVFTEENSSISQKWVNLPKIENTFSAVI